CAINYYGTSIYYYFDVW
nr:immunoglobulin heavy chain junction region [Mus musculus]